MTDQLVTAEYVNGLLKDIERLTAELKDRDNLLYCLPDLKAENERLRAVAYAVLERKCEGVVKLLRITLDNNIALAKEIEELEADAAYLSAEVKRDWELGRVSVDAFHAALAMDKTLAAQEKP